MELTRGAAAAPPSPAPPPPPRELTPPRPTHAPYLQTSLALLPNLTVDPLPASMFEVTNDAHLSMYIASLGRSVVALHDLLQNKRRYKDVEREGDKVVEEKGGDKAGEKAADKPGEKKPEKK